MYLKVSFLVIGSLLVGFCYGYFAHRNKIFPYNVIKKVYLWNMYHKSMQWTIGIYKGTNPFNLSEPVDIDNPVISAGDVIDIDAAFIADPFMVKSKGQNYVFFEAMNLDTNSGDIGYAISENGNKWEYRKIILDEAFHLSYPSVIELNGEYYMIPESSEDQSVRLYKASPFPEKWECIGNLLSGSRFYDPTVFYHNNKWWMFTSGPGNDFLNLFFSDSLTSGWEPHPMNPLIKDNKHIARPAGKVFIHNDKLYRLAQDDDPYYGVQVFAVEITELTPETYKENSDSAILVVKGTGNGWNAAGMHHVDLHKDGDKWYAVVDGIRRRP